MYEEDSILYENQYKKYDPKKYSNDLNEEDAIYKEEKKKSSFGFQLPKNKTEIIKFIISPTTIFTLLFFCICTILIIFIITIILTLPTLSVKYLFYSKGKK
jgi:hypothetical protein